MENAVGGGISSIIQSTKTKLLVISSLLGVGAIYYFTRNYLRNGQLLPNWVLSEKDKQKINKSKQPRIIGGTKRSVSIVESTNQTGSSHRQQRSRKSSVSSRKSLSARGIRSIPDGEFHLDRAIIELDNSLLEMENIFDMPKTENKLDCVNTNGVLLGKEIERLRKLLNFAQDVKAVTKKTSEYVTKYKDIENEIEAVTADDLHNQNYNELYDYIQNQKSFVDEYDSDNESFISAAQSVDSIEYGDRLEESLSFQKSLKELISKNSKQDFYMEGIEYLTQYGVPVRTVRSELLNCTDEVDFCVKVFCIRRAFKDLLQSKECRDWFVDTGREMLVKLMKKNYLDPSKFTSDFNKMINFCENSDNWPTIDEELSNRGVCCLNFYDIVLDFMIMDSFDDLSHPPSSVISAIQNRWLSQRIKETALSTAIWTVIKGKKKMLKIQDGFYSRFYDVSMHITPMLAWGFLGPVKELNEVCFAFKDTIVGFLQDIFSTNVASYKTVSSLATDIYRLARERKEDLMKLLV